MDAAIGKLRDEITGVAMERHRGQDRALAMVLTKLDEARLWVTEYQRNQGEITVVPRAEILQRAFPAQEVTANG